MTFIMHGNRATLWNDLAPEPCKIKRVIMHGSGASPRVHHAPKTCNPIRVALHCFLCNINANLLAPQPCNLLAPPWVQHWTTPLDNTYPSCTTCKTDVSPCRNFSTTPETHSATDATTDRARIDSPPVTQRSCTMTDRDRQIAIRKRIVAAPDAVAVGIVKAHQNDPVHGCKCGQEHDWMSMVRSARMHDAAETARAANHG